MAKTATYRNADTGEVREYPVTLQRRFPALIEVEPNAKPLAYTRIPQSSIDAYLASQDVDGDDTSGDTADDPVKD
jgi:hypothetical protein